MAKSTLVRYFVFSIICLFKGHQKVIWRNYTNTCTNWTCKRCGTTKVRRNLQDTRGMEIAAGIINESYYMQNLPIQRVPNPTNINDYWYTDDWFMVSLHIAAGIDPYNFVELKDGKFILKDHSEEVKI